MVTTAELSTIIANKLTVRIIKELVWADITSAVVALSTADKNLIVAAARTNNAAEIGRVVLKGVQAYASSNATSETDTMMSDNTLDFTELDRVLG